MVIPENGSFSERILGLRPQNQLDRPQSGLRKVKNSTKAGRFQAGFWGFARKISFKKKNGKYQNRKDKTMKRILLLLLTTVLLLASCGEATPAPNESSAENSLESSVAESSTEESAGGDTIPPAFVNAKNGKLPSVSHDAGSALDLLEGVEAMDNVTAAEDLQIAITNEGGYDPDIPGTYTVTVAVTDEAGNKAEATVEVTVRPVYEKITLTLGGEIPYRLNDTSALVYTSSGTSFRTADVIQVMDKDFFLEEYNAHKAEHTNNGTVPFFPNGVIVITDENGLIVQVRIACGETIQINADNSVKTSGLSWTNSIDATSGGGMFKGLAAELDSIIPNGGQLLFVGNPGAFLCRTFLIQSLFSSDYVSGALALNQQNIYPIGGTLVLE